MLKTINKGKTDDYVYDISLDGTVVNALGMNVCSNTDGFNFRMPSDEILKQRHYVGKGLNREVVKGKEYEGYKADVAEFNDLFMRGKMGLGIDELAEATINFSRKNYADLLLNEKTGELEKKLVGNTIKSKKMPVYIEKFLDKGIDFLLKKKGQEFIESYYDYIEKIYNYEIPLKEIASKGKIKKTLDDYVNDCKTLTKAGTLKSRQAWYELLLRENPRPHVDIADIIYYINVGTKSSDSDVKRVTHYVHNENGSKVDITRRLNSEFSKYKKLAKKCIESINSDDYGDGLFGGEDLIRKDIDKYLYKNESGKYEIKHQKLEILDENEKERQFINSDYCKSVLGDEKIYSESTIYLNCKLLDASIIDSEEDVMCNDDMEYNSEKYIDMFNKRITPLLVCFNPEIRDNILITNPKERRVFTDSECELDSGHPIKQEDQDTFEALMTPSRQEVEYWVKINEEPPFVHEIGMDWENIKKDYFSLLEREKNEKFQILNEHYIEAVERLSKEEIEDFIEENKMPVSLMKYVYVKSDSSDLNFYFKEIPDMMPTQYSYIGDINYSLINESEEIEENDD